MAETNDPHFRNQNRRQAINWPNHSCSVASHYLNEWLQSLLTYFCVIRVKRSAKFHSNQAIPIVIPLQEFVRAHDMTPYQHVFLAKQNKPLLFLVKKMHTVCYWCYMWRHNDVIKWKKIPRYWPFLRGIHLPSVNSPDKDQRRGAFMFSLICAWINGWVNNREAGDLRRHRAHYEMR